MRKYPESPSSLWHTDQRGHIVRGTFKESHTCLSAKGRQLHGFTYEAQSFSYGSASNWAHGMPQALIRMGGRLSYWAVTGRPPRPSCIVLQCWGRYNLQWILIPAKQCSVPWEMSIGYRERKQQHTIEWDAVKYDCTGPSLCRMCAGSLHSAHDKRKSHANVQYMHRKYQHADGHHV